MLRPSLTPPSPLPRWTYSSASASRLRAYLEKNSEKEKGEKERFEEDGGRDQGRRGCRVLGVVHLWVANAVQGGGWAGCAKHVCAAHGART